MSGVGGSVDVRRTSCSSSSGCWISLARSMSEQILPKRFGLKYSPRPMIALEYQRSAPDSGELDSRMNVSSSALGTSSTIHILQVVFFAYHRLACV